jgi:hypothetical protein
MVLRANSVIESLHVPNTDFVWFQNLVSYNLALTLAAVEKFCFVQNLAFAVCNQLFRIAFPVPDVME